MVLLISRTIKPIRFNKIIHIFYCVNQIYLKHSAEQYFVGQFGHVVCKCFVFWMRQHSGYGSFIRADWLPLNRLIFSSAVSKGLNMNGKIPMFSRNWDLNEFDWILLHTIFTSQIFIFGIPWKLTGNKWRFFQNCFAFYVCLCCEQCSTLKLHILCMYSWQGQ